MLRWAVLLWSILAVVFAGTLVLVVLNVPTPAQQDMRAIPIAAAIGALLAVPVAILVARHILSRTKRGS